MLVALLGFGMPDGQTASHVTNVPNVQSCLMHFSEVFRLKILKMAHHVTSQTLQNLNRDGNWSKFDEDR